MNATDATALLTQGLNLTLWLTLSTIGVTALGTAALALLQTLAGPRHDRAPTAVAAGDDWQGPGSVPTWALASTLH